MIGFDQLRGKMQKIFAVLFAGCCSIAVVACDNKPKHYFVICDAQDGNRWKLIDTEEQDGYLIACTYQAPDLSDQYTSRCDDEGCGIK